MAHGEGFRQASVAVDGRGRIAADLDGADRPEERDARECDVGVDVGAEDGAAPELAFQAELELFPGLCLAAFDGCLSGRLRGGRCRCLHGGPDGVAGRLLGREPALLDAREERHEEEQRKQHAHRRISPEMSACPLSHTQSCPHGAASAVG